MQSTVHTTLGPSPTQLVFGRNVILNILHKANCQLVKRRKQELCSLNNARKNKKRVAYTYNLEDLVLVKISKKQSMDVTHTKVRGKLQQLTKIEPLISKRIVSNTIIL